MPRKRSAQGPAVHTTMRLPRPLHDRLVAAAGDKGIAEEIRQRLEASFEDPFRGSPRTREYLAAIADIARELDDAYGSWDANDYAKAIIAEAARLLFPMPATMTPAEGMTPAEFEAWLDTVCQPAKPGSRVARLAERHEMRGPGTIAFFLYNMLDLALDSDTKPEDK